MEVQSLGWEDPLEKEMATHSNILAWENPWTLPSPNAPGRAPNHIPTTLRWGSGNPLRCSCLENPRGGGAWWAVVYGVSQSRMRLK